MSEVNFALESARVSRWWVVLPKDIQVLMGYHFDRSKIRV